MRLGVVAPVFQGVAEHVVLFEGQDRLHERAEHHQRLGGEDGSPALTESGEDHATVERAGREHRAERTRAVEERVRGVVIGGVSLNAFVPEARVVGRGHDVPGREQVVGVGDAGHRVGRARRRARVGEAGGARLPETLRGDVFVSEPIYPWLFDPERPPLVTAIRFAPSRARSLPPSRSQTMRGRCSPKAAEG